MIINEIFHSISGECGNIPQGTQVTFIRLAGCNLKCPYCDTPDTQSADNGVPYRNEKILEIILSNGCKHIFFTGGEPLLQEQAIVDFIRWIEEKEYRFNYHMETNGTLFPISVPFKYTFNV